jgi:hypothetical protein
MLGETRVVVLRFQPMQFRKSTRALELKFRGLAPLILREVYSHRDVRETLGLIVSSRNAEG